VSRRLSDVGNLYEFIKNEEQKSLCTMSFLSEKYQDLTEWKKEARFKIRNLLHYSPKRCDLNPQVVEKKDKGDYFQEKVYFFTASKVRVPAYVLIPKNVDYPVPGIVVLHDHGGMYYWGKEKVVETENEHPMLQEFKNKCYSGRSIANELVRRGYVAISIDAFYFGERRFMPHPASQEYKLLQKVKNGSSKYIELYNRISWEKEELVARTIFLSGFTWPGVMLWDDIRTVDYLTSRYEVDPDRIGCVGLSIGGYRAAHLSALDERIKVSCVVCWMSSYRPMIKKHVKYHTWMIYIPGLYKYLDLPDIVSLTAPNALLVIAGSKDPIFPLEGVKMAFKK